MSDFPRSKSVSGLPLFISTHGKYSVTVAQRIVGSTSSPAAQTWTSGLIAYVPVSIPFAYPVNRVWWVNGSTITTTNVDFGIYTSGGAKIYGTGSTAMSGASSVQYVTPSTKFVLAPDRYYFAWVCDNTTARGFAATLTAGGAVAGRQVGLLQQAGSIPLPASATPASWAQTFGAPLCGVTRTISGF